MTITTMSSRAFNQDTTGAKKASSQGPVIITDRGRPSHVLLTYADYELMKKPRQSVGETFAMPADADFDIEFPRCSDGLRDVDLSR